MDSNKSCVEFDEVNHIYRVDGKIVPSVTQLLPKQDYFVSDDRLAECASEGTSLHNEIENYFKTGKSTSPFTDAVQRFMDEMKNEIGNLVCFEKPLASSKGYAGKPDMIFENAIVDLKRTYKNKKIHALQTAAYHLLAFENGLIKQTKKHYILVVHSDGTYKAYSVYDAMAETIFLSLVMKHKIEKSVEYYLNKI
jgi:hypothetical protein